MFELTHKAPTIQLFYRLTVTDKTGRVVRRTKLKKSHSFVIAFLQLLEFSMVNNSTISNPSIKAVNGTSYTASTFTATIYLFAPVATSSWGIVVGTSSTTPTNIDNALGAIIANGSGAGQLMYGSTGVLTIPSDIR